MVSVLVNELDVMGGTHKQVLRFCQYLDGKDVEYKLLTKRLDYEKAYSGFRDLNIDSLNNRAQYSNSILRLLLDLYLQFRIFMKISRSDKIVNVHDNGFPLVIFLCRTFGKKVYWQINDLPGVFKVGNAKDIKFSSMKRIYTFFIRQLYRFFIARCVSKITVNVSKNKVRVAQHMGVDAEVYYCGVDEWSGEKFKSNMDDGVIRLLSSGVFFPYRNYETQLEVVKVLAEKGYKVTLNIIGSTALDPDYASKILRLIKEKSLEDKVFVHGQVDHQTYLKLHSASNVFLFVNVDQSWGLSIFEAMSAGLPVIVSDSVGAVEILHDGDDSIVVNPKDTTAIVAAIERLADKDLYKKLSVNGASYVGELTWDDIYSRKLFDLMGLKSV